MNQIWRSRNIEKQLPMIEITHSESQLISLIQQVVDIFRYKEQLYQQLALSKIKQSEFPPLDPNYEELKNNYKDLLL